MRARGIRAGKPTVIYLGLRHPGTRMLDIKKRGLRSEL